MGLCSAAFIRELSIVGFLLVAAFSSVFGTLLAIFVPQTCENDVFGASKDGFKNLTAVTVSSDCTFAQNVYIDISPYNGFVLGVNFLTLLLTLGGYIFEFFREKFIVTHFDVDYEKPDHHLKKELNKDESLKLRLTRWNKSYNGLFISIALVYFVNVIVSGILVFSTECAQVQRVRRDTVHAWA